MEQEPNYEQRLAEHVESWTNMGRSLLYLCLREHSISAESALAVIDVAELNGRLKERENAHRTAPVYSTDQFRNTDQYRLFDHEGEALPGKQPDAGWE